MEDGIHVEPAARSFILRSLPSPQDEKVELFVSDVNSHLRQRQEHERLKTIIARIESYEPVVSEDNTTKQQSNVPG